MGRSVELCRPDFSVPQLISLYQNLMNNSVLNTERHRDKGGGGGTSR